MFEFHLAKAPQTSLKPGQYVRRPGARRDKITICCPGCEGEFPLAKHYVVAGDGRINPRVRCPFFGCGWEQDARLIA